MIPQKNTIGTSSQKRSLSARLKSLSSILFVASITAIIIISLVSYHQHDSSFVFNTTEPTSYGNWLGMLGAQCAALLLYFFGSSAWLIPLILAYCLRTMFYELTWSREIDRLTGLIAGLFVVTAVAQYYSFELYSGIYPGGWFGNLMINMLHTVFAEQHIPLFLFMLTWALAVIIARFSFVIYLYPLFNLLQKIPFASWMETLKHVVLPRKTLPEQDSMLFEELTQQMQESQWMEVTPAVQAPKTSQKEAFKEDSSNEQPDAENPYALPPLTLFTTLKEQPQDAYVQADSKQRAGILEHKLERFGIKGKVKSITQGPAVTLFEYQPSIDTKISTILAREDDLALALQALSLRIIAPIPGRSVIGFEVAHNKRKPVLFSQAIKSKAFSTFTGSLPLILGKDTLGHDVVINLALMPHLLVAGSTGSGKSVGLHTMVMSLLCSKTPDEIKLILIDPKRLEFAAYADTAHLLFPIVTDPRRAISVLKWAVTTMEDRYALMAHAGVRSCTEFNSRSQPGEENYLPLIIIVIDELADLMMTAGKDVEQSIARLAQMARAAGIHLIAATQRPSVDVITGLIKVNFPSRIAYKVTSKIDSRTILDMAGAEKLLGKGDMLFLDVKGSINRVHGAYVTDPEISAVVTHIKTQRQVEYKELTILKNEDAQEDSDELFQEIINYIKNKDEISISLIQRVFRIGYNRSARIIDQLESYGYILPANGAKMRKVAKET